MNEDMQARLLKKYKDHAKNIESILMISPLGHHRRNAAAEAFNACMDLGSHQGSIVAGRTPETSYWKCNPDCLTCFEHTTEMINEVMETSVEAK